MAIEPGPEETWGARAAPALIGSAAAGRWALARTAVIFALMLRVSLYSGSGETVNAEERREKFNGSGPTMESRERVRCKFEVALSETDRPGLVGRDRARDPGRMDDKGSRRVVAGGNSGVMKP